MKGEWGNGEGMGREWGQTLTALIMRS